MEDNILNVFSVDVDNISLEDSSKRESIYYSPKQEGNDPYSALIRILPIPVKNAEGDFIGIEKDPYFMQKRYWLVDDEGNGSYFTSAMTIGSKGCPIQKTFYKLKDSDDVRDKKLAEKDFKISTHYWSLVYIIKDKQNPDLQGKILIWRYPSDVKKLIENELTPPSSEYAAPKDKVAVWALDKGKNLALVVSKSKVTLDGKERIFPSYDKSEFVTISPFEYDGVKLDLLTNESVAKAKELFSKMPDEFFDLKYKEWDEATALKVKKILKRYDSSIEVPSDDSKITNSEIFENDGLEEGSDEMTVDQILKDVDFGE